MTFQMKVFLQADTVIRGYEIPKGSVVVRVGHSMSNSPDNFGDPKKFLPERWLRGSDQRHTAHSFANLPWGHGARFVCLAVDIFD